MLHDHRPYRAQAATRDPSILLDHGRTVIEVEIEALRCLAAALDDHFSRAVDLLLDTKGRVILTGMGKSGHIARKMAATFSATGMPAFFVHPGEAAHGDLGMMAAGDTLVALSNSGATAELMPILIHGRTLGTPLVAITSQRQSPMARMATVCLGLPATREACPANLSPTTSTTLMLALGDALAVAAMRARGIDRAMLRRLHPGGSIGASDLCVEQLMHAGTALPLVSTDAPMADVVVTITEKSFGIAGVVDATGRLVGTISDGDLRRRINGLFDCRADAVMSTDPRTVPEETRAQDALALMTSERITALFVTSADTSERPIGLVHIHDFGRSFHGQTGG